MASRGVSLYKGSDECDLPCDVCQYQNISSQAISYCNVCKEALCTACDKVHRASKLTRNHQLLTGDQLPAISGGSQVTPSIMTCDKHQLAIQYFCPSDNVVFCRTCKMTSHRTCDTTDIGAYTAENNPQMAFECIQNRLTSLETAYERLYKQRKHDKSNLSVHMQSCLGDVERFRNELNEFLDDLEEKLKAEIVDVEEYMNKAIDDHLTVTNDTLRQIREQTTSLNEYQKTGQRETMFVGLKKTEVNIAEHEHLITVLEKEICSVEFKFQPDDKLVAILNEVISFGRFDRSEQKEQATSLLNMTASEKMCYKVNSECMIQAVIFMPNDHIVLACVTDGLILLDQNFRQKTRLPMRAITACKVSDTEVLVAEGVIKQLQFVEVSDTMIAKRVLKIEKNCVGVDYNNGEIYVACGDNPLNAEIRVLSMNGEPKRRLVFIGDTHMFSGSIRLKVNHKGDKVFVLDIENGSVTCLDQKGQVIYKYSNKDMKHPCDLYIDGQDNVFVSGDSSHNIHVITARGELHQTLLTEKDGIRHPLGIAYRPSDGCLAIGTGKIDKKNKAVLFTFKTKLL